MIEKFKDWNPHPKTRARVEQCAAIIDEYSAQGYKMTLRQVFYQLVGRALLGNSERNYRSLGKTLTNAREAGMIDWAAIEDRGRRPDVPSEFSSIRHLVDVALRSFRLPRWEGQSVYAELWVEKSALASVLQPIADKYHVVLMANKGYSSASAMYDSAQRVRRGTDDGQIPAIIFYIGDHDPSGLDMVRDIRERLDKFTDGEIVVKVKNLALTIEQVQHYNLPPNPTKLKDARAEGYVAKYGYKCWEVDALQPDVLHEIIADAFDEVIDADLMDAVKEQEGEHKAELEHALMDVKGR